MVNKHSLQKILVKLESSSDHGNLNGFPIKPEQGFRYKIGVKELIVIDEVEYVRTCIKRMDELTGQVISETFYHQAVSPHN
jgi:hypothetical protein